MSTHANSKVEQLAFKSHVAIVASYMQELYGAESQSQVALFLVEIKEQFELANKDTAKKVICI